ncbi:MAG: CBM9 family sugar-binding protein, partial [Bacteroidales bacterium]|nr:CBM9 family sugar-binding protein [Bacteroidales bacterium]
VARDADKLYFLVETDAALSPKSDRNWMLLFIDVDRDKSTGWNGYDYVVNRINPDKSAVVEKNVGNRWEWEQTAKVKFAVNGNRLELEIPRKTLGLENKNVHIEFKWNDNMQENGNIMDFYVNGDTAPGGRFNFLYRE